MKPSKNNLNPAEQPAQESVPPTAPNLGRKITGWTNNLIATAVVIVVALVVGTQLITLWSTNDESSPNSDSALMAAWPTVESCAIEFGNNPYTLQRNQVKGDQSQVVLQLLTQCKTILDSNPLPAGPIGKAEQQMIQDSIALDPLEEATGRWRVIQVKDPTGRELPMVIGLRDDCPNKLDSKTETTTRMVVWGIGLASSDTDWTTFVCQTRATPNPNDIEQTQNWIPTGSRKTLSLRDKSNRLMIGFHGGEVEEIKQFYSRMAKKQGWSSTVWVQNGNSWHLQLVPSPNTRLGPLQIRMELDNNHQVRGLLVVSPPAARDK